MAVKFPRLVGDIGGTNIRFAIASPDPTGPRIVESASFACNRFPSLSAAILAYTSGLPPELQPGEAALAIAGPVQGDVIRLTNQSWQVDRRELAQNHGWDRLLILNDFTANALSLPHLAASDLYRVGGGDAIAGRPIGVLGPGTGLGVSGLIQGQDGQWVALDSEGGHATLAAADDRQSAALAVLRRRFDHVSAERVLSGAGLVSLYSALAELAGQSPVSRQAADILDPRSCASDPICAETVQMFCAFLGGVAGNLALILGAEGGIFIAGGIVPRLGQSFADTPFRQAFEAKGRFQSWLAGIPSAVIIHPHPALIGLAQIP